MSADTRQRVVEWLTGADTSYLIGAGCSLCAGKPLIGALTSNVLSKVDLSIKTHFEELKGLGDRAPTIEDLINYLVRYRDILSRLHKPQTHHLTSDWIDASLTAIKKEIVTQIADNWEASPFHAKFLLRIKSPITSRPRDIFSLNYDTVLEATLDALCIPYIDGFRGTRSAWFDSTIFDESPKSTNYFRLFKLHGSINWGRSNEGRVRRIVINSGAEANDPIVVYPSEQKYFLTQYGIYESMMLRFRNRLRQPTSNNCLIVLGYSFNDEHINEAIIDAISSQESNLTVIAFVGPDEKHDEQKARLAAIAARCDNRFNVFVGNNLQIGNALSETEGAEILAAELWKFENLVNFVAGGTP